MATNRYLRPKRCSNSVAQTDSMQAYVLNEGELFIEYPDNYSTNTVDNQYKIKVGDGLRAYKNLPYAIDPTNIDGVGGTTASTIVTYNGTTAVGSSSVPVYVSATGVVTACTSIALNATTATTATTATKLGSSTVGGTGTPIYLSGGSPTACSLVVSVPTNGTAVGSSTTPVYINSSGVATACGSIALNAASASKLGSSTVGSAYQPIYLKEGAATSCVKGPICLYANAGVPNDPEASIECTLAAAVTNFQGLIIRFINTNSMRYMVGSEDNIYKLDGNGTDYVERVIWLCGYSGSDTEFERNIVIGAEQSAYLYVLRAPTVYNVFVEDYKVTLTLKADSQESDWVFYDIWGIV